MPRTSKTKPSPKKTAKKVAKKTPKRSTTPKKTIQRRRSAAKPQTAKTLVCATGSDCFWVQDGPILKDLAELRDALKEMTDVVFNHHVTRDRNDFADWVEWVLRDEECAEALRKSRKSNTARLAIVRQLRTYSL